MKVMARKMEMLQPARRPRGPMKAEVWGGVEWPGVAFAGLGIMSVSGEGMDGWFDDTRVMGVR